MGELKKRGNIWWIRYSRNGKRHEESAGTTKKGVAVELLKLREGDGAHGLPVTPKIGRFRFREAAQDLLNDYRTTASDRSMRSNDASTNIWRRFSKVGGWLR